MGRGKAFVRLQEEILKETDDHSLFAWRATPESEAKFPYRGILASSPGEFALADDYKSVQDLMPSHMSITNLGIQITGNFETAKRGKVGSVIYLSLNCKSKSARFPPRIALVARGGNQFVRAKPSQLFEPLDFPALGAATVYVTKHATMGRLAIPPQMGWQHGFHLRWVDKDFRYHSPYPRGLEFHPEEAILETDQYRLFKANETTASIVLEHLHDSRGRQEGLLIAIHQSVEPAEGIAILSPSQASVTHRVYACHLLALSPLVIEKGHEWAVQAFASGKDRGLIKPVNPELKATLSMEGLNKASGIEMMIEGTMYHIFIELGRSQGSKVLMIDVIHSSGRLDRRLGRQAADGTLPRGS